MKERESGWLRCWWQDGVRKGAGHDVVILGVSRDTIILSSFYASFGRL
jgi:hypothetical protein